MASLTLNPAHASANPETINGTNRRAFLAGAVASGVAVVVPAQGRTVSPIAALIEAERAAYAAFNAATDALEQASAAWRVIQQGDGAVFLTVFDQPMHISANGRARCLHLLDENAADVRRVLKRDLGPDLYGPMMSVHDAMVEEERARINAAADQVDAAREACGLNDAEQTEDAALKALEEARYAILRFPARTPTDIDIKADWLRSVFGEGRGSFESDYADALLASFTG